MNNLLYICFNRPDLVEKTLPPLMNVGWDNIVVLCDGPRDDADRETISVIQNFLLTNIWSESASLNLVFRKVNMGCRRNIEDGLKTFFKEFGEGWVFEDDVLLTNAKDFIELRSRSVKGHVSLYNHLPCVNFNNIQVTNGQYFVWGWYLNVEDDINFKLKPSLTLYLKLISVRGLFKGTRLFYTYLRTLLNMVDTWDSIYRCWAVFNDVENYVVGKSYIRNIGFDSRATHTSHIAIEPFGEGEYRSIQEWNRIARSKNPSYIA